MRLTLTTLIQSNQLMNKEYEESEVLHMLKDVWALEEGYRIEVKFNKYGQAIGNARHILGEFLGSVARKGNYCSLHYKNRRKVPDKEDILDLIKGKFTFPENNYRVTRFLKQSVGSKWSGYKNKLRKEFFIEGRSTSDIISKVIPKSNPSVQQVSLREGSTFKHEEHNRSP